MSSAPVWTKTMHDGPRDGEVHTGTDLMPEVWFHNFTGAGPTDWVYGLVRMDRDTLTADYRLVTA